MTDQEIRLKFGEMNAGEMRLARALVAWHEREIAKLKEDLTHAERWRDKLDTKLMEVVEAAERAGWNGVENSKNLPTFITYLAEALSKAQAYDAARPQAAEIASLKAALAESEKQFQDKVDEIASLLDERDKAQGILKSCLSVMPFGNIETHTVENLPGRIADLASEITAVSSENERLEAELAALRQPILADDGRSLGQVACECYHEAYGVGTVEKWQAAAQAVVAAARPAIEAECLALAVQRMEAVPVEELCDAYEAAYTSYGGMGAVRARLILAFKGEGQPVVVNEPPHGEKQPGLSGESESQTEEPAWIPHDGGPCPLKDEEVEEWQVKWRDDDVDTYKNLHPSQADGWDGCIIAYRVLKWKPGFGPEAKAEPATFEAHGKTWTRHTPGDPMPCDGEAWVNWLLESEFNGSFPYRNNSTLARNLGKFWTGIIGWRYADEPAQAEQATAQPWTPTVGDTVRLKSGGPVMTVYDIAKDKSFICCVHNTKGLCDYTTLPAACLTPAQP